MDELDLSAWALLLKLCCTDESPNKPLYFFLLSGLGWLHIPFHSPWTDGYLRHIDSRSAKSIRRNTKWHSVTTLDTANHMAKPSIRRWRSTCCLILWEVLKSHMKAYFFKNWPFNFWPRWRHRYIHCASSHNQKKDNNKFQNKKQPEMP